MSLCMIALPHVLNFAESIGIDLNHVVQGLTRIVIYTVLILALLFIFVKIRNRRLLKTVTKFDRGTKTERDLVLKLLKHRIPAQTIFHDLYLRKHNDHFAQIDLVAITEVGIIVFEVKKYSGWIYGYGDYREWNQVLGMNRYYFYNPVMQNNKHIEELREQLEPFGDIPYFSVIVFYGNCVLSGVCSIPKEVFFVKEKRAWEVVKLIFKNNPPVNYTDKNEVVRVLKEAVKNGEEREIQIQHVENIKEMFR